MKYQEILETFRLNNSGDIGKLEHALNLWVEGKMKVAQALLLQLESMTEQFRNNIPAILYRGFLVSEDQYIEIKHTKHFVIKSNPAAPLASWSTSKEEVHNFMFGWERPWIMLAKKSTDLDVFINLSLFTSETKPFTKMGLNEEIIVKMPTMMNFHGPESVGIYDS